MKPSRFLIVLILLASSVTLAQEGKFVFINGKYVPYRASGRYEINGETIFYKNERTYDRVPENTKKEQLDPYGRPIVNETTGKGGKPNVNAQKEEAKKMLEAYSNRVKAAAPKGAPPPPPPSAAVPLNGNADGPATMAGPTPAEPSPRATGPAVNVIEAPPQPQGEKSLAEPSRSY